MDYLALYRKYRPKDLNEVVGQDEIKKILASSIKNGTVTHAYLFSGPRGTGKTTMAKILAKMVNCESPVDGNPCGKCKSCLSVLTSNDVIEIDAASNNGVDEIRDLREKASLVPVCSKYKVYIIDEVHMLTTQAFNALLKTLEEPPKHVIFILATTEYYKIPLTITSRCQKFQFNKITTENIVSRLKKIAELEKINISDEAIYEIAKISDGGMRDSINFLDQIRSFNTDKITIADVYRVCGSVSFNDIIDLLYNLKNNKTIGILDFFEQIDVAGVNYSKFLEDFASVIKDVILYKQKISEKYIKYDLDKISKVVDIYDIEDLFYLIKTINSLIDKLKVVSKQSVIIVNSFLLMMYELDKNNYQNNVDLVQDDSFKVETDIKKSDNQIDEIKEKKKTKNRDLQDKEILVNNAFAVANKDIKKQMQIKFGSISEYLSDKRFSQIAGIFVDILIEVAGDNYVIFSTKNDGIIDKVYDNYKLCKEFLTKIFNVDYNFVVISDNEWQKYRDEYIENIHNGKTYEIIELNKNVDEEKQEKTDIKNEPTIVDKLFDLVGGDSIEFK